MMRDEWNEREREKKEQERRPTKEPCPSSSSFHSFFYFHSIPFCFLLLSSTPFSSLSSFRFPFSRKLIFLPDSGIHYSFISTGHENKLLKSLVFNTKVNEYFLKQANKLNDVDDSCAIL